MVDHGIVDFAALVRISAVRHCADQHTPSRMPLFSTISNLKHRDWHWRQHAWPTTAFTASVCGLWHCFNQEHYIAA